jgi:hypothetical protein
MVVSKQPEAITRTRWHASREREYKRRSKARLLDAL